jgi:type IV secretion system protein VirB3
MDDVSDDRPQLTPLVIGLTRPPMMWGIPLNAFYIIVGVTLIAFLVTTSFWSALIVHLPRSLRLLQPRHPHP